MKTKKWTTTTSADSTNGYNSTINPIAKETIEALNYYLDKTWPIYKLTNTDMKNVRMTLETARGLYKDATPEMKKWLEENFKKEELVDDYTPPSNVYAIMNKYGINTTALINTHFANKLRTSAKLTCLMQDYHDQTGWIHELPPHSECYYSIWLGEDALQIVRIGLMHTNPFIFKTEQHAQKFIDAYKNLLLEYFNAK